MDDQKLKDQQREAADDKLIEGAFKQVLDIYLASRHRRKVDIITKAFNFARQAHKGVRRLSGEPYIMHPIAVARIAAEEMGLGSTRDVYKRQNNGCTQEIQQKRARTRSRRHRGRQGT